MRHILVVANETLVGSHLTAHIQQLTDAVDVFVVVPVSSRLNTEAARAGDTRSAFERANDNLRAGLAAFARTGIDADGRLGCEDPMEAIDEVMASRTIDHIVLSTLPSGKSRWLGMDLPHRVERRYNNIPVDHIVGAADRIEPEVDVTGPAPVRVLLVEDDSADIELAKEALDGLPQEIDLTVARHGAQAVEVIRMASPPPDLILLDLKMPVLDGHGFLEELGSDLGIDTVRELNVAIVSSSSNERDRTEAHARGARAYVVKDPDFDVFQVTLASLVTQAAAERA